MKLFLVLALASWALSLHISRPQDDDLEWELFKIEHEKVYEDEKEEHLRQIIFMKNLDFIRQHNKKYENGEVTFTVGVNQFADMTKQELRSTMNGFRVPGGYVRKGKKFEPNETLTLPASVDWRLKGAVTGVKNQGKCGSCWAFSTTGSLEGQHYIKSKNLISLSEQNLIDCTKSFGNHGCRGGQVDFAFTYVLYNYGIDTEASYPYKAQDMSFCKYTDENRGATCTGYVDVTCGSEAELQQAVATIGPISVAIDASFESFKLYQSGIYMQPGCSTTALDHAVLVVGYNITFTGGQYWLVKNSWGTSWGMGGYIMMARNHSNMCGIASSASFPIV